MLFIFHVGTAWVLMTERSVKMSKNVCNEYNACLPVTCLLDMLIGLCSGLRDSPIDSLSFRSHTFVPTFNVGDQLAYLLIPSLPCSITVFPIFRFCSSTFLKPGS